MRACHYTTAACASANSSVSCGISEHLARVMFSSVLVTWLHRMQCWSVGQSANSIYGCCISTTGGWNGIKLYSHIYSDLADRQIYALAAL